MDTARENGHLWNTNKLYRFVGYCNAADINLHFFLFRLQYKRLSYITAVFLILAVLKLLLGISSEKTGLIAEYYPNAFFQGAAEQTWHHQNTPQINFTSVGYSPFRQTFPLYFFNDWHRFNNHERNMAFSARWKGQLLVLSDNKKLELLARGGSATLIVNNQTYRVENKKATTELILDKGLYSIELSYQSFKPEFRHLQLNWADEKQAISYLHFSPSVAAYEKNVLLYWLNIFLHILWLVLLLLAYSQAKLCKNSETRWIILYVLIFSTFFIGKTIHDGLDHDSEILPAGSDYLLYETQARAILTNGWLDGGTNGSPFHMNILYRYCLSGLHLIFGESISIVKLAQHLLILLISILIYFACKKIFDFKIAILTLIQIIIFYHLLIRFPKELLDTTFSIGFSFLALYFLLLYKKHVALSYAIGAGALLGIAILTRGNFMPFVMVALIWLFWCARHLNIDIQIKHILAFSSLVTLPLLLVGLRNLYVADIFIILPQTGLSNFWLGNRPPEIIGNNFFIPEYTPPREQMLNEVVQYMFLRPLDFMQGLLIKALYIVGIDMTKGFRVAWHVILPWLLLLYGSYRFWYSKQAKWSPEMWLLWSWIAVNFLVLVMIFPWGYGWRLSGAIFPALYILNAIYWHDKFFTYKENTSILNHKSTR